MTKSQGRGLLERGVLFWLLLVLMVGFAAFARFYDLKSDPPAFFAHGSQDLTTDGAYLTLHARQAVLEGEWDLFGYKTWTPFKVSVLSGVSYLLFQMLGTSRVVANLAGGILNLAGILLFLFSFWDTAKRRFLLLLALFLCTNYMLTIYGRVPFSENGLFFLGGLTFLVFTRWFDKLAGKVAVGLLVGLCGLLGKSFGFLLGAGPLVCVLIAGGEKRIRDAAALVVPFIGTFVFFWMFLYRDQGFFTFLWEHGTGVHGYPHGFESPRGFLECLISYGRYGLHSYSVAVSLVFYLAVVSLLLSRRSIPLRKETALFMVSWVIGWIIVLSPFNYLPLRYFFLLFVPMAVGAAAFLDDLAGTEIGGFGKLVWWRIASLLIVNWMLAYYLCLPFLAPARLTQEMYHAVWTVLPVAILLTAVMMLTFRFRRIVIRGAVAGLVLIVIVACTVAIEGYQYFQWSQESIYTVEYANDDVSGLVGKDAVIAGQYGPAITAGTSIRSFPYFLTDDTVATARIIRGYPVTHVAVGEQAWDSELKKEAIFQTAQEVTRFWVRDAVVVLARVTSTPGSAAWRYRPSDFEEASLAISRHQMDSAEVYLRKFLSAHPNSRTGLANTYYWTLAAGALTEQKPCVDRLTASYPTDFAANLLGAIYYKWLGAASRNTRDKIHSEELLDRAIHLNPIQEESIRRMYQTYRPDQPVM
jgi:hypothetical protein